jgi:hypothetical protein
VPRIVDGLGRQFYDGVLRANAVSDDLGRHRDNNHRKERAIDCQFLFVGDRQSRKKADTNPLRGCNPPTSTPGRLLLFRLPR